MRKNVYLGMLVLISIGMQAQEGSPIPCTTGEYNTLPQWMLDKQCILEIEDAHMYGDSEGAQYIKASERIVFKAPTTVHPVNGSMSFTIGERAGVLNIAWLEPAGTYQVPRYEKLELGIQIPTDIQPQIDAFIAENPMGLNTTGLNPFDPDQIDVYAVFERETEPGTWTFERRINGFYFEEYEMNYNLPEYTGQDYSDFDWVEQSTLNKFRVRYAPRYMGRYRCIVYFNTASENYSSQQFEFDVINSENKGYVEIGYSGSHFQYPNGDLFFPIGHNLHTTGEFLDFENGGSYCHDPVGYAVQEPEDYSFTYFSRKTLAPVLFDDLLCQLLDTKAAGANAVRTISFPWDFDIEYLKLNNYYDRMHNAWEFDRYIELAEDIDIKVDWCMQVHYTVEDNGDYGLYMWDWDANDLGQQVGWGPNQGYCYKTQLGLGEVKDFFTDPIAKSNYKKKLRYNIARWGYSTAISNIELFSEINNAGETDPNGERRYINDVQFRTEVFNWQRTMAQYIKEDLAHNQHLLSSSYAGYPNTFNGNPYAAWDGQDVIGYNCFIEHYCPDVPAETYLETGNDLTYAENPYLDVYCQSSYTTSQYNYQTVGRFIRKTPKPFVFSEIGPGDGSFICSRPVNNIRNLLISPFTGAAGAGYSWDNYTNPNRDDWYLYENVANFFEGLHLNSEIYEPWSRRRGHYYGDCNGSNLDREDGYTTVYYLKAGSKETGDIRMIGCVVNNLYNEYQSFEEEGYASCGAALYNSAGFDSNINDVDLPWPLGDIFNNDGDLEPGDEIDFLLHFHNVFPFIPETALIIDNLNKNRSYKLQFYSPFYGEYFEPEVYFPENCESFSDEGFLRLNHPALTWSQPILFFELHDTEVSGVRSIPTNSASMDALQFVPFQAEPVDPDSGNAVNIEISVYPNPSTGKIYIELSSELVGGFQLFNSSGQVIDDGIVTEFFELYIPIAGEYFIRIISNQGVCHERITIVR
ncbi:MAG: T9SS type A sorting domain-containing protein [Cryomorphaceae bacterium]|nr:T9SS type A sorting domain-containing protein [Cryomorphaceae bacterium]